METTTQKSVTLYRYTKMSAAMLRKLLAPNNPLVKVVKIAPFNYTIAMPSETKQVISVKIVGSNNVLISANTGSSWSEGHDHFQVDYNENGKQVSLKAKSRDGRFDSLCISAQDGKHAVATFDRNGWDIGKW